jgi:hypothetical protein
VIIVLEGPDCAGKSTMAKALQERIPGSIILKQGPPRGDILETYLKPIEQHGEKRDTLILDRWHVGELIYGPLLRGKSLLTVQQAAYIDMVLQTYGAYFFHVTAPLNVLEDRYDIRADALIKREWLQQIQLGYLDQLIKQDHWAIVANFGSQPLPATPLPQRAPRAGNYIGPANPEVLLLGDKRNDERFIYPFVPTRASSGHWLMGALHAAGVDHMKVGIMNALEVDPGILFDQWWQLGKPPIVTLGANARRQWRIAHGGDWNSVATDAKHPQWMRRFNYTSMESYGEIIKGAMS